MTEAGTQPGEAAHELQALFDETRSLFHCLQATAAALHRQGNLTAGLRGMLLGLAERGPQTVPQAARTRPTSRQHIQALVNRLRTAGLVSAVDNPDHRRSKLLRLTPAGERAVAGMRARETALLARADVPVSAGEIASAAATLRSVREMLMEARFRGLVNELAQRGEGE